MIKFKFKFIKDSINCNEDNIYLVKFIAILIDRFINNDISFAELRRLNPLYSNDGRPNYLLYGYRIYYLINHSDNSPCPELATYTDRFFWEVYKNPGPYSGNDETMNSFIKKLAKKSLMELNKSINCL